MVGTPSINDAAKKKALEDEIAKKENITRTQIALGFKDAEVTGEWNDATEARLRIVGVNQEGIGIAKSGNVTNDMWFYTVSEKYPIKSRLRESNIRSTRVALGLEPEGGADREFNEKLERTLANHPDRENLIKLANEGKFPETLPSGETLASLHNAAVQRG